MKNNKHRKSELYQICAKNPERIAGYFEGFLAQIWYDADFSDRFD